jgi:hypothetical protein
MNTLKQVEENAIICALNRSQPNFDAYGAKLRLEGSASELLVALKWTMRQLEGESGSSAAYWTEFPEYHLASELIARLEAGK